MLHFLATIALCIFIGERLGHYSSAWRLHRAERRELRRIQALYNYNPRPLIEPSAPVPPPPPSRSAPFEFAPWTPIPLTPWKPKKIGWFGSR